MTQYGWQDCPDDVRLQVTGLLDDFRRLLGGALLGVYLHGSLAMGCFNPGRSDLDLLVLAQHRLSLASRQAAARLLLRRSSAPRPIEISILTLGDLHPWRHPAPFEFHFGEDWRERIAAEPDSVDWMKPDRDPCTDPDLAAHLTVTRARGLALHGPPPARAFPAIPPGHYLDSIAGDFESARDFMTANPASFVLNACRVLAFVEARQVLSKDEGGQWGLRSLSVEWHDLIRSLLGVYRGQAAPAPVEQALLERFARTIAERIRY
jgi:streptomycin 3"-adenylyltransferase